MTELVDSFIEITLPDDKNFLKVRETLTRIGVGSVKTKTVYQSCHILHKRGRYYIVHFKEMFLLDGKPADMDEQDTRRRNRIAKLLDDWGLVKVVDTKTIDDNLADMSAVLVIPFSQKENWTLKAKYQIGK